VKRSSPFPFLSNVDVDKADCVPVRLLASVCTCLNIACAGLSSFDLLFSQVWERLDSQLAKEALSPL